MKFVFSTRNVIRDNFLDLCKLAWDYGFSGFEIYDALAERKAHFDSILTKQNLADARRKLHNRGLQISALTYPSPLDSTDADSEEIAKYVRLASNAGVPSIIVRLDTQPVYSSLEKLLLPAIRGDCRQFLYLAPWM